MLPIGIKIQAINKPILNNDITNGKWWTLTNIDNTMQSYTFKCGSKTIITPQSLINKYLVVPKHADIEPYFKMKFNC